MPGGSNLTIDDDVTLDLGGTSLTTLDDVVLDDGAITDGALIATGEVTVENGTINADMSGMAYLDKEAGAGADTLIVNGECDLEGQSTGVNTKVNEGTLLVNGSLFGTVDVGPLTGLFATMGGVGTISGTVTVDADGTLGMDGSNGDALTMGALDHQAGCTIAEKEDPGTGLLETAQADNALTINGGNLSFPSSTYPNFAPFRYCSIMTRSMAAVA